MKKIRKLSATVLVMLTAALHSYAQSEFTNGLVAYYPFNGNANDASGNGNNGTPSNASLVTDRFGTTNGAYQFNGNGDQGYIEVQNSTALAITNVTATAWVYITNSGGYYILKKGYYLVPGAFHLGGDESSVGSLIKLEGGPAINCSATDAALTVGAWTHVAAVFDGQKSEIYVNGQLKASVPAIGQMEVNSYPLYIGADYNSPGGYFNGRIDDVRIYSRALSGTELQRLYAIESTRPHTRVAKAVRLDHEFLRPGFDYQLQVSQDLNTWTNLGPPFSASAPTNSQYLDVGDWNAFYRLTVP